MACALALPTAAHTEAPADKPERKTIYKRDWKPWAHPTVRQVHIILREEQNRWGGPSLRNRVACESGFRWNATNGTYDGLLQFGPIWYSMYRTAPREVIYVSQDKKNGVRRKIVHIGHLPRNASAFHGWAAIRTGQRAVSGDGPTTGWACGL